MRYLGIDWASDHHDIAVVNEAGEKLSAFRIGNDTAGLETFRDRVRALGVPKSEILISIETSRLLLVDFLLNEGFTVYPINPKAIDRYRDRYTASYAKSDAFDAELIAHALRTDRERFRALEPDSPLLRELRILVRDQKRLIWAQSRFLNQLGACLREYYPAALNLFGDLASPVALQFLKRYPRPEPLSAKKLEKFLRQCRHPRPEAKAQEIAQQLSQPQFFAEPFTVRARSRMMLTLVDHLLSLRAQIAEYQEAIDDLFAQHPDSGIFKSLPGSGEKTGPRLLSEIGDNRSRYSSADSLQCEAGTCPITRSSGKVRVVMMRQACRKSFRDAMHMFSFCSLTKSSWARALYDQQRAKGKNAHAALRAVSDKWLKIIHHLWKEKELYDENIYLAHRMRHQMKEAASAA